MQRKCGKPERCVFIPQPHSMRVESSECRRLCLKQPAWTPCRGKRQRRSEPSVCLTPNRAGKTDQWEAADCAAGSTKHEMCYKICKLALMRHTLRVHTHARTHNRSVHTGAHTGARAPSKSLPIPLYFPAQSSCSQMASWVWGSATPALFVDGRWFFHAIKALPLSPVMPGRRGVGTLNLRFRLNIEDRCECSMWRGRWYNV